LLEDCLKLVLNSNLKFQNVISPYIM